MLDKIEPIARNIQLAVTPVFLLTAIGTMLAVLTTRLGRVVDRARDLEERLMVASPDTPEELRFAALDDLAVLDRRMGAVNLAIALCTAAAFLVCIVIAILFLGEIADLAWAKAVVWLFLAALVLLAAGLALFLAEIRIALRTVRVRAGLLAEARPATRPPREA